MYVPEAMQLNRFVDVAIPSKKMMFSRLGEQKPLPEMYTGDEPAIMNQDKVSQMEMYDKYASEMSKEGK